MNVTDIAPVQIDRHHYLEVTGLLFEFFAFVSFIRVMIYVIKQAREKTLINSRKSPPTFPVAPVAGWMFACSVLLLLFSQSAYYILLVVAGIWAFLTAENRTAEYQFGIGRISGRDLFYWTLLVCGAVFFVEIPLSNAVDHIMTAIQLPHPLQQSVEEFNHFRKASDIILFMLPAVLIYPVIEELFFRGFLFSFLKRFTNTWSAIILSAGVFAFAHTNLGSVLQLWILGVVLGLAYEKTGSLLLPIGVHGCFNLVTAISLLVARGPL